MCSSRKHLNKQNADTQGSQPLTHCRNLTQNCHHRCLSNSMPLLSNMNKLAQVLLRPCRGSGWRWGWGGVGGGVVIQEAALQQYTITHSHQLVPTSSIAAYLRGSGPTISLLLCLSASGDLFLSNKQPHCSFCGFFFFMKNSKSLAKVALPTAC